MVMNLLQWVLTSLKRQFGDFDELYDKLDAAVPPEDAAGFRRNMYAGKMPGDFVSSYESKENAERNKLDTRLSRGHEGILQRMQQR
jgi:hypothetical protein